MPLRRALLVLAVVVTGAVASAGCAATKEVTVGGTTVQGIEAPTVAVEQQCGVDVATLQAALDAYVLLKGAAPADGQALVTEGFLREFPSDRFTVTPSADGTTATLTGIGPCAD